MPYHHSVNVKMFYQVNNIVQAVAIADDNAVRLPYL